MRRSALLSLLLISVAAHANGRAPLTNGVHFRPGDSQSIYVATTFGFLVSHDDGCTFHWICEQDVGYGGTFDPKYAIASDGTIFATTYTGLRVSRDGGCSFTTATADKSAGDPGRIADVWIDALDIGPTGEVWVATADSGKPNDIYRSTDNGATFEPKGMQSPTIWWKSVRVAPSRAQRIYVAGYQVAGMLPDGGQMPPTAHMLRSDDGGTTWTGLSLSGVVSGTTPIVLVAAVDPGEPQNVLAISLAANPPNGDRLYRSTDGGDTFAEVLATAEPIRDVVFRDSAHVIVALPSGSQISSNGGVSFEPMAGAPQLSCVGQRGDNLVFGCGANWQPDYMAVARSSDAASWQKAFRFVELAGPLECPAGTAETDACAPLWPSLREQFGTSGPTCGSEVQPDGSPPPSTRKAGGCCDAGSGSPVAATVIAWFALIGIGKRRRRPR